MKKNKIFAIVALLAVTISGVLVFQACKKSEQNIQKPMANSNRKPIAVYNHLNKKMEYKFDIEKINEYFNQNLSKDNSSGKYIVESIAVLDENPIQNDSLQEVKFVVIDTDSEETYTVWLMGSFTNKIINNNSTEYYLSEDLDDNNYKCYHGGKDGKCSEITVNEQGYSVKEVNNMCFSCRWKWWLICKKEGSCQAWDCQKVNGGSYWACPGDVYHCHCVEMTVWDRIIEFIGSINININISPGL